MPQYRKTTQRILLLGAPLIFLAAAQTPARDTARVSRYLIVSGDNSSGSWDSRDEPRFREWRARYGSEYAWFRQGGRDYIIADEKTLDRLQLALAPQREVNRKQDGVNRLQDEVNRLQDGVNSRQSDVNRAQDEVNHQQNLANQGKLEQSRVNDIQSEVNAKQHLVNVEQDKVNERQSAVNKEQEVVNQVQTRVSAEIDKALQELFDAARRQGVAHELR